MNQCVDMYSVLTGQNTFCSYLPYKYSGNCYFSWEMEVLFFCVFYNFSVCISAITFLLYAIVLFRALFPFI